MTIKKSRNNKLTISAIIQWKQKMWLFSHNPEKALFYAILLRWISAGFFWLKLFFTEMTRAINFWIIEYGQYNTTYVLYFYNPTYILYYIIKKIG